MPILGACSGTSVEEDIERFCDCMNTLGQLGCIELGQDLSDKYEFSPDEAAKLIEGIRNCEAEQ